MSRTIPGMVWAIAASVAAPILRLHLRRRADRGKEVPARLGERRGLDTTARPGGRLLWMHAASVGETVSILPVLSELAARAPDLTVLLTTGTVTSAALLERRLPELGLERQVMHRFAPLDVPAWTTRFLDHWRPDAAAFVESELWPNLLAQCRTRRIPLALINARMSAASYTAWRRVPGLAAAMLRGFACIRPRAEEDAKRLRALGATMVERPGDLKFAAPPLPADTAELERLRAALADRPVWVAASTHSGEEALVAVAHATLRDLHPGLVTILAPRHPERGVALASQFGAPRRGAGELPPPSGGLWIADTLGEMGLWYRLAQVSLVGRSLLPPGGGQNPLEPARLHCPVVVGPHVGNFTDHVALLRAAGGLEQLAAAADLARCVGDLLARPDRRRDMAGRAAQVAARHAELPAETAITLLGLFAVRGYTDPTGRCADTC